jgi:hypothetical protein
MFYSNPIRLAWWNTGLAPAGNSRGTVPRYETAARVIRSLLVDEEVDFLALGETAAVDLDACLALVNDPRPRLLWRTPKGRRTRASSLAVGYDSTRLTLLDEELITDTFGGVTFTTGWRLAFEAKVSGDALNVVVVHWPSHMRGDAAIERKRIASSLHIKFRDDRDVLIVGDFNDEPFSESMSEGLAAYRDRNLVRKRIAAYYNPFWRLLGEQQSLEHEGAFPLPAGTHFYRSGSSSRWFTFDQFVVSSALLEQGPWRLVENATRILRHEALFTASGAMRDIFDHLPIATSLKYFPED